MLVLGHGYSKDFKSVSVGKLTQLAIAVNKENTYALNQLFLYHMNRRSRIILLLTLTVASAIGVFLLPPVHQSLTYHDFADKRTFFRIPNFFNVVSNVPFLFVGAIGLLAVKRASPARHDALIYLTLFSGVFLTGIGSAYYHYHPDNNTLVWDRIPMTLVFMSLLTAVLGDFVNPKLASFIFLPALLLGVAAVLWWHFGDLQGKGDLRLYGFIQFYPALFIPLIVWLFCDEKNLIVYRPLIWVIVWYAIAKLAESLDNFMYFNIGISGHTVKHLAAAISTWFLVRMFRAKYVLSL